MFPKHAGVCLLPICYLIYLPTLDRLVNRERCPLCGHLSTQLCPQPQAVQIFCLQEAVDKMKVKELEQDAKTAA